MLATGGTAPYTFVFDGITQVGNGVFTGIAAGTGYTWSVNDANNCGPVTGLLDVAGSAPLAATATVTSPILCAGSTATVTIVATNGTAPYIYTFNGVTQIGNGVFTGIPAGTAYAWSVSEAGGCPPVSGLLDVTDVNALTATITAQTFVLCTGFSNGFATVVASGGTPGYTYAWNTSPVQTTPTATNLPAGTYIVVVTDANGCTASDTAVITEVDPITANAGPGQMLCNADVTFLVGNSPLPGTGSWVFVSGPNVPSIFPPVGSVAVVTGMMPSATPYVFSYSINNGGCLTADTMTVTNYNPPTPSYAGIDQEFCSAGGNVSTTLEANTPVFGSGFWSQVDGPSVANIVDPLLPNTAVTNLTFGVYAFQWTVTNGVCQADADIVNIFVTQPAIVDAGNNAAICEGYDFLLADATAGNFSSLLWSSSGTGIFNDPGILNPLYTPSSTDITNGIVSLTLTAEANSPCPVVSDQITLTINSKPLVFAGADASVCGTTPYLVTDATAQNFNSYFWTTTGTGLLTGGTTLNPTYTPSAGESGDVMLILNATAFSPCSGTADTMHLQVTPEIIVNAGPDTAICQNGTYLINSSSATGGAAIEWTTSGTGTFNLTSILHPEYTPSTNDIQDGFVFLTITATGSVNCPSVSDVMKLNIAGKPTAFAGPDASVCQSSVFNISQATAQNFVSVSWVTTGLGILTGANTLIPSYTPAAGESGTIVFNLLVTGNSTCGSVSDQMLLFIQPATVVNAGPDQQTCELSPVTLSGSGVMNGNSLQWTTSGNGTFSNASLLNPVYTPGSYDAAIGSVMLTLRAAGTSPCPDVTDQLILTINKAPQADAGPNVITCVGTGYTINQASASNYSTLEWSVLPASAGVLSNSGTLNPTFTPSAGFTGTATLSLKVTGTGSCGSIVLTDAMDIFINSTLSANAGADQIVYPGAATALSGSAAGGSGFYAWSWEPASLLVNPTIDNPLTLPINSTTTFTLTVLDISTGCTDDDSMVISVDSAGNNSIVAIADYDTTLVNVPVTINVLANDINPGSDPLTVNLCGFPSYGIVVLNSDKTITYTPYTDFEGDDILCYRICNALQPTLCSDTLVYIHVKQPSLGDLIVYNGVSPNGDGNNDTWKVKGIEKYPDNTVLIFNRWGDQVRAYANYNNTSRCWDGTNEQGDPLPDGTYFYILNVKNVGSLKGWIMLRDTK